MVTANETTTVAPETQASEPDTLAAQQQRAATNKGDTVRASWRFSLDTMRSNIAYLTPEAKDLLVWAFTWCIDPAHPVPFESFCERVGYNTNTMYKIYSGKYLHPETKQQLDAPEKLLKNLRSFRRLELSRARLGAKRFIRTPTAKKFFWACDQARKSNTPVFIISASQIGKTWAGLQYCLENNHGKSIIVEIEAVNGLRGLLQALAVKLGISPNANTPDLIARIKKALTPDMVVIFDELHLLANVYRRGSFFACMEQLRRIFDATKAGFVFTFTQLKFDEISRDCARELEQVFRRGVHVVNLGDRPLVEDIKMFAEDAGLSWADRHEEITVAKGLTDSPWGVLKQLAATSGLTAIVERFRLANDLASDQNRTEIEWSDFLKAHFAIERNKQQPAHGWDKEAA